jgi:hypothetical protein
MNQYAKQPLYGPHLKVVKTGEVCELVSFAQAMAVYEVRFSSGAIKEFPQNEIEAIPPHEFMSKWGK